MSHEIDRAQDLQAALNDSAVAAHAGRVREAARSTCAECLDPIPAARQAIGAARCIGCQAELERAQRQRGRP